MNKAHAILSPSGASRWLACTPSARLEQQFPDIAGSAAKEGTLAHILGELLLRYNANELTLSVFKKKLAKIEANDLYDISMYGYAEDYAGFVLERLSEAKTVTKDAILEIEVKLDLTDYIEEGFGTGDAIIIADGTLDLIDMKYGKGVLVNATENKQMMVYALGALKKYDFIYDIKSVRMTIYQPRLENFSSWEIPVKQLNDWAEQELKPRAALAFEGKGEYRPGDHCRFCRARAVCKVNAGYQLELARFDFQKADLLEDADIADILERAGSFENWLTTVKDYALTCAINDNKKWPGFKLVEGRSNRVIAFEDKVVERLKVMSYGEEVIYNKKLKGIGELEKLLGKKEFGEQLGEWVIKPQGKPTLVPESDKRPELNSVSSAISDFKDVDV